MTNEPSPTPIPFTVTSTWNPLYGKPAEPLITHYSTLAEAVAAGMHIACIAGILTVTVTEGKTRHCDYARNDNCWNSLTDEAQHIVQYGTSFIPQRETTS